MTTDTRDALLFRISAVDRAGLITDVGKVFGELESAIAELRLDRAARGGPARVSILAPDNSETEGYGAVLKLCRGLQSVNNCNHLYAEFVRSADVDLASGSPPAVSTSHFPAFESFFSGQLIRTNEPLHPVNTEAASMKSVQEELSGIASGLIAHPERLLEVSPRHFEAIVAEIYRSHGFDVKVTGGSSDHGIDVEATVRVPMSLPPRMSQHLRIGIQVKRYKSTKRVREKDIRDLFGSVKADGYDRGVLVTTSSLTAAAKNYISARRTVQERLTILCGDDVLELLVAFCRQRWIPFWR